jgi:hypothetical protein
MPQLPRRGAARFCGLASAVALLAGIRGFCVGSWRAFEFRVKLDVVVQVIALVAAEVIQSGEGGASSFGCLCVEVVPLLRQDGW